MFEKHLVILLLISSCACYLLNSDLIVSFLKAKHVKYCSVLTCYNKKDEVDLAKGLSASSAFVFGIINLKNLNILNAIYSKYKRVGIILDGDCQNAHNLLEKCGRYKCFDSKHFWLITHSSGNYTHLFGNVNMNIDSEINVAYPNMFGNITQDYVIHDVYNPSLERGGDLKMSKVGTYYDTNMTYEVIKNDSKYCSRRNLTGVLFKTLVVLPQPYSGTLSEYLQSDKNKEVNILNRFHSRLMHYCRDYYNFSMTIRTDVSWGFLKNDGTMDGLVGELERRNVDFGLSPLLVKPDRAKVIMYGRKTWDLK